MPPPPAPIGRRVCLWSNLQAPCLRVARTEPRAARLARPRSTPVDCARSSPTGGIDERPTVPRLCRPLRRAPGDDLGSVLPRLPWRAARDDLLRLGADQRRADRRAGHRLLGGGSQAPRADLPAQPRSRPGRDRHRRPAGPARRDQPLPLRPPRWPRPLSPRDVLHPGCRNGVLQRALRRQGGLPAFRRRRGRLRPGPTELRRAGHLRGRRARDPTGPLGPLGRRAHGRHPDRQRPDRPRAGGADRRRLALLPQLPGRHPL